MMEININVTEDKVLMAEQQYRSACFKNAYAHRYHQIDTEKYGIIRKVIKWITLTVISFAIFVILHSWIDPEAFCTPIDYIKDTLSLVFFLFVGHALIKPKFYLKKIANKIIPLMSEANIKGTFKDIKQEYLPLVAKYEFNAATVSYHRILGGSKKFIWQKSLNEVSYFLTADAILFYPNSIDYPAFMIFVDDKEVNKIVSYLEDLGCREFRISS